MFANGYVGTSEDAQRLRKLDKQREQQRKKFEKLQEAKKNEAAGLRQFGSSKAEAYEAAFKTETVGLVTRKEFIEKRATIQERLEEDELRERLEAEAAAAAEKERRRKEKEKKRAKAKLSFAADVSHDEACAAYMLLHMQLHASVYHLYMHCSCTLSNPDRLWTPWVCFADPTSSGCHVAAAASLGGSNCVDHVVRVVTAAHVQDDEEAEEEAAAPSAPADKQPAGGSSGDEGPSTSGAAAGVDDGPALKRVKFSKLGKDPGVATSFLPDKDRELQEEEMRQQLKRVRHDS